MSSTTIVRVVELIDTNKTKAAFLAPLILAIAAALGSWIITGDWSDTEIRTAASGAVLGVASGIVTFITPAGQARVPLRSERGYGLIEALLAVFLILVILLVVLRLL